MVLLSMTRMWLWINKTLDSLHKHEIYICVFVLLQILCLLYYNFCNHNVDDWAIMVAYKSLIQGRIKIFKVWPNLWWVHNTNQSLLHFYNPLRVSSKYKIPILSHFLQKKYNVPVTQASKLGSHHTHVFESPLRWEKLLSQTTSQKVIDVSEFKDYMYAEIFHVLIAQAYVTAEAPDNLCWMSSTKISFI